MPSPPAPPIPGFRLLHELGRGAMGVVWLAHEERLGRDVALKVLREEVTADPEVRARFEREVRAAARLRHPNIVPVLTTGEAEGRLWYAMEYVAGPSLDGVLDHARGGRMEPARAVRIAREVARALHVAHEAGVTHRDVKPGNVLVVPERAPYLERETATRRLRDSWLPAKDGTVDGPVVDRPRLVDFGLAMDRQAAKLSVSGMLIGTPGYMAPEQFEGPGTVGPATDQWALGVLLYECLTGRLPFTSDDLPTLARSVTHDDPVPPSRIDPHIDRDLETIVLTCLRRDPAERYPDAAALADDLGHWLREEPILARPPGPIRRLRGWARRRPVRATAIVALVLVGLGLLAWRAAGEIAYASRVHRLDREAHHALEAGDPVRAEELFAEWIALAPADPRPRDGRERARALRQVERAEALFGEAEGLVARVRAGEEEVARLRQEAEEGARTPGGAGLGLADARGSEPWWMREPAYRARVAMRAREEQLQRERAEVAALLAAARSLVDVAAERAGPPGAAARRRILEGSAAWHMESWRRAREEGDEETAALHRAAVERLDRARYLEELRGVTPVTVEPADVPATAWLFRYEPEAAHLERGGPRLLPLPYDPATDAITVPPEYGAAVAERLAGEGDRPVRPETPSVTEPFSDTATHVGTMAGPLRRERYEAVLRATAYPLVTEGVKPLGVLGAPLQVRLAEGRYLLLLRAPGRVDLRLPFEVHRRREVVLRPGVLPTPGAVPAGFVPVPGGPTPVGGDEVEPTWVGPFLAARFEVTYADWWAFLNDPRTTEALEAAVAAGRGLRYVPRIEGEAVVERRGPGWAQVPGPERPVADVALYDVVGWVEPDPGEAEPNDYQLQRLVERLRASETVGWGYLAWRTERSRERARAARDAGLGPEDAPEDVRVLPAPGGGWRYEALRFTLPTQAEWERMARGGDRRLFAYGDEREWLHFKGSRSRPSNPASEPVGLFPDDESPFGVRDLTGSVAEWTADWKEVGGLFFVRGASWADVEPGPDEISASRSLPPDVPQPTVGLRLVVRSTEPVP